MREKIRRTREKRASDRAEIARLALFGGLTQEQIAEKVSLDQTTVSRELKAIRQDWVQSARDDVQLIIARELKKFDALELQLIAEWERSKQDHTKKVVEKKEGSKAAGNVAKLETAGQCGDPRYILALLQIHEKRARLLGLEKPQKFAPTTPDGELPYRDLAQLSESELNARIAELERKYSSL